MSIDLVSYDRYPKHNYYATTTTILFCEPTSIRICGYAGSSLCVLEVYPTTVH